MPPFAAYALFSLLLLVLCAPFSFLLPVLCAPFAAGFTAAFFYADSLLLGEDPRLRSLVDDGYTYR